MADDGARRVWLITGAARGLGRAFTTAALDAGDRVVATVRDGSALADLRADHPDTLRTLVLDVRDRAAVQRTVAAAIDAFGQLDVVVNNAGYGLVGAAEEVSEAEARAIVDTDFLGPLWVTQAVLPHLRERGAEHIVQVSTTGAVGSMATLGMYNAAKWALEGFSEALAAEVRDFGTRVTIAELAGFDTDWPGSSMQFATPNSAYDTLRAGIFGTAEVPWPTLDEPAGGEQDGGAQPEVAARALLAHVDADDGPLRLLIGDQAAEQVAAALTQRRDDYAGQPGFTWPSAN